MVRPLGLPSAVGTPLAPVAAVAAAFGDDVVMDSLRFAPTKPPCAPSPLTPLSDVAAAALWWAVAREASVDAVTAAALAANSGDAASPPRAVVSKPVAASNVATAASPVATTGRAAESVRTVAAAPSRVLGCALPRVVAPAARREVAWATKVTLDCGDAFGTL